MTKNQIEELTNDGYIQLDIRGPELAESAEENPFTDYKLDVTFTKDDRSFKVNGYFAADGEAGESGADKGSIWRVRFTPPESGTWTYILSFEKGSGIVDQYFSGQKEFVEGHGSKGAVDIQLPESPVSSFRVSGGLEKDGHYLKTSRSGKYFLKMGANSPENLLAFKDFDGTYYSGNKEQRTGESAPNEGLHLYEPHVKDWKEGDPTWKNGKGKGLIGALNYLASKGMNSLYFLTMNIGGDGEDVFPYRSHQDLTRFDCSKLDQWDIVFTHAEKLGIVLHIVTQETENETLMDQGEVGIIRNLYYRELVARFSYHNNVIWNMGEENGPADFSPDGQTPQQRLAMADWFVQNDPHRRPVFIHSHAWREAKDATLGPLLGVFGYDGISMQVDHKSMVNDEFIRWRELSALSDQPWILTMDEIGLYHTGAKPDNADPGHDSLRVDVLWGSLMAGGSGVEWYFGYRFPNNDLDCEDWRTRDNLWTQTAYAKQFFEENVPWWEMEPANHLIESGIGFCLSKDGEVYLVLVRTGMSTNLDLTGENGEFSMKYFDPRNGVPLGNPVSVKGGKALPIELPANHNNDYVVLLKK